MNPPPASETENLAASQLRRADGLWEGIARVRGMDCGACAVEIEHAAKQVPGLQAFAVNPASQLASWVASGPQSIEQMAQKAARLGYALGLCGEELSQLQTLKQKRAARNRFLRFLVAALCMMQIMMYSTPEYIFHAEEIGQTEARLLRWAQWVLALPLILYCAAPYLRRAWVAACQHRLVMDQPIVLGLLLAFVLSSLNLTDLARHVWFDSIAMLLSLLLLVQLLIENQTAKALSHLAGLQPDLPLHVELETKQGWRTHPVAQLRAGNTYRLFSGLTVPMDSLLRNEGEPVWVDEAMRTGESEPVCKRPGELVQAGSRIQSPWAVLVVKPAGDGDSLSALGQLLLQALATKPEKQDVVQRVVPWFVFGVLSCALMTALYWYVLQGKPDLATSATLAVLIVTCPCALALALPLVRLFGVRKLADLGVLVRNPLALDTINRVRLVAMDKTGTLTSPRAAHVLQTELKAYPAIVDPALLNALLALASQSAHPLAKFISSHLLYSSNNQAAFVRWKFVEELPGKGLVGVTAISGTSYEIRLGSAAHCGIEPPVHASSAQVFASCCNAQSAGESAGLQALQFSVLMGMEQALPFQLSRLKAHGLGLHLLSGDHSTSVATWAPQLLFNS
jgi:P-type Cu2+ transporter